MEPVTADVCVRIRAYVSLELDDELSELERSILESHVGDCADCCEFRRSAGGFTTTLRAAPVEAVGASFRAPSRRRRLSYLPATATASAAAAVAAAAMVVAGFTTVLTPPQHGPELVTTEDVPAPPVPSRSPTSIGSTPGAGMRVL